MFLNKRMNFYIFTFSVLTAFCSLFLFQNCSKNSFSMRSNPDDAILGSSDNFMLIEEGKPYTNKKVLKVKFQNLSGQYLKMRLALTKEMTDETHPWVDYSANTTFDLKQDWSLDGSADGTKTIYSELRELSGDTVKFSAKIGLDTLPPQGNLLGILSKGLQGKQISEGQKEPLSWTISDVMSSSNFSSGLSDTGMTVATTTIPDCSSSAIKVKLAQAPYKNTYTLTWPQKQPNEAFYVCVFVADKAGNTLSLMSQPMLSLWRVFAGDNTQGNGGSINSQNVRFQYPTLLAKNSKNEVFIYDSQFNNIRKVDENGIITLVAGSGKLASIEEKKDAQNSPLPTLNSMVFDSSDTLYVSTTMGIYKLIKTESFYEWSYRLQNPNCKNIIDILKVPEKTDVIYMHAACNTTTAAAASSSRSYIYKINLADLEANPITSSQLTTFRILGNGKIPQRTTTVPKGFVTELSSNESDLRHAIDYPGALRALENGDLIINTIGQYSNNLDGRSWISYLKKINTSQFERYDMGFAHVASQMDVARYKNEGVDFFALFIGRFDKPINLVTFKASDFSAFKMQDLEPKKNSTSPNPWILGVLIQERDENQPYGITSLLLTATANSQIFNTTTNDFAVKNIWGRDFTTEKSSIATEMQLLNPTGLVQTQDGNTYIFDRLNSTVYRVDTVGVMTPFLGNPANVKSTFFNNTALKDVTFDGTLHPTEEFDLLADETTNVNLFLSIGGYWLQHKSINVFNLKTQKAQSIFTNTERSYTNLLGWSINELNISPSGKLLTSRIYIESNTTAGTAPTAVITEISTTGTETVALGRVSPPTSAPLNNVSLTAQSFENITAMTTSQLSHLDNSTAELLFVQSSYKGKLQLGMANFSQSSPVYKTITAPSLTTSLRSLHVVQLDSIYYLIGSSFDSLWIAEIPNDFSKMSSLSLEFKKACVPGTFLNNAKYTSLTKDKNLLISDVNSGRVLEYYLHSKDGQKMLMYSDDPLCTAF